MNDWSKDMLIKATKRAVTRTGTVLAAVAALLAGGCAKSEGEPATVATPVATGGGLAFTDATAAAGLGAFEHRNGAVGDVWFPEAMGSGGGFIDYDGDGWQDILLIGGGVWPHSKEKLERVLWLYRNNGDGTFTLRSAEAGLEGIDAYGLGLAVGDYDNDGDADFYITTLRENLLFRNDGGRFTEVGRQAGVAGEPTWSSSAIFFDADRDGHLDLYVGNYVKWTPETDIWCSLDGGTKGYCTPETYQGVPSRYYRNNGDGTFTDQTEAAGFLPASGKTLGVAEFDFNRDGWPDLFVANDTQPNLLYVNDGDGTFTEQGAVSGIAYDENGKARAGMGIDVGVVDTTGEPSLFVGNFSKEMIGVYRHLTDGLFIDRAAVSKIGRPSLMTLTFGLFLFDVDLDGDLDLFAANGHVQPDIETTQEGIGYAEPPHLFLNAGDGTFEDVAAAIGGPLTKPVVARGAAYADYDRDGDLDMLITENAGPAMLYRNELNPRLRQGSAHFLRVAVEGRTASRDAYGAHLVAYAGGRRIEQRVRSGSSYLAASERVVTFGLGAAAQVDSLVVHWPSGDLERFTAIPANREVRLVQGSGRLEERPAPGVVAEVQR